MAKDFLNFLNDNKTSETMGGVNTDSDKPIIDLAAATDAMPEQQETGLSPQFNGSEDHRMTEPHPAHYPHLFQWNEDGTVKLDETEKPLRA